jgi:hypothetical protein
MSSESSAPQGHLKRPLPLLIITIVYAIMPVYYLVIFIINILSDNNIDLVYNISFFLVVMTFGTLLVAWGLWKINKFGWFAVIIHSIIILGHNFIVVLNKPTLTIILQGAVFQVIMIAIVAYFVIIHSRFRVIFFDSRLRWWESDPRYHFHYPAILHTSDNKKHKIMLDDISDNGIKSERLNKDFVTIGDRGCLSFEFENQQFEKDVEVIWIKEHKIGLKFVNMTSIQKKKIKHIIKTLKQREQLRDGR